MSRTAFFDWLLRHRAIVLILALGIVLVAGHGARRVRIDYGVEQFFLQRGPERERYDAYKKIFPREDTRVSLFWEDRRGPSVALYRDMERVAGWFEDVGLEDVQWLGSVIVARRQRIEDEVGIAVGPIVSSGSVSNATLTDALRHHRDDRLLEGFLWDSTQKVLLLHGYLPEQANTDTTRRRVEVGLEQRLAALDREGTKLVLTGLPIARARAPQLLEGDMRLLLGAAFVVFFLILYWFFRHPAHVILSLISVAPAYLCVLGALGYSDIPVSILTSFIPIIVLVVGMSDAVHILTKYRDRWRATGDRSEAIVSAFSTMAGPCFYTSLTTAVGFASLAGTRIGIVVDFGLFTAVAILLTFVFSMTVFPVLLSFVSHRRRTPADSTGWLRVFGDATAKHARRPSLRIVIATAAVSVMAFALAMQLRVDTYLIDDTKKSAPFMQDIQWIDERGFGFFQVNVLLTQTGDRPLHAPEALSWMEDLRFHLENEPLVTDVTALPDFLIHLRRASLGRTADPLPETVEEASQLLLMAQLQNPAFVDEVYHQPLGAAQVIVTVRDEGSRVTRPFLDRLNAYLADHPFPVGTAEVTGTVTMISSFTARLLQSFGPSIVIAIFLITAIMMRMLRSVKLGLLALFPNLVPLLVVLGVMALLGYSIKPSTILVLSIAFGIAVDNTIHLLTRVVQHVQPGGGMSSGLVRGLQEAAPVMIVTTMIVTAGFALLMASHFQVLFLIGLMTAVTAVTALVADLFVLPSVIALAESQGKVIAVPTPAKGHLTCNG